MNSFFSITLLSSCVSALVLQPLITPAPHLDIRGAPLSVCGYYLSSGTTETISCAVNTPCLVETDISPAVGYCSRPDDLAVTTIFDYGKWPLGGCGPGSACCPAATPKGGKWLFGGSATVMLGCGQSAFSLSAYFGDAAPTGTFTPALASATATVPSFGPTTPLAGGSTATAATPLPSQTGSSTGFSSTTTITVIVVGAVVFLVGGLAFLWLLFSAWRVHQKNRYQQPLYSPLSYQNSTASLPTGSPSKKSGLSKWAKIMTIISAFAAIAGLVVSVVFGVKQK